MTVGELQAKLNKEKLQLEILQKPSASVAEISRQKAIVSGLSLLIKQMLFLNQQTVKH